jgi:hypothetical protein
MTKRILMAVMFVCSSYFLFAQETTCQILGTVTDGKTGLAGATVVALHTPTGTRYTTTTRKDGRFNLPGLRIGGPYKITTSFVGYKTDAQEDINLVLGQDFTADFSLTPETTQLTEVVVTSTPQNKIFNNSHTGSQEIITRTEIQQLPTINRSISDFTKLEPTANSTSFGTSFGGRSAQYNNITVDGANFNNGFGLSSTLGGQTGAQPISLDAIDQVQVNVSPYDVRQGGFTGAGVNAITKSGTNQFRGDLYTYLKGPGTQGYNVEDVTVAKSPFSFYTRGASIGGPIIKNKLFFYVNYEAVKQTSPAYTVVASGGPQGLSPSAGVASQANYDSLTALSTFLKTKFNYDPGSFQGYSFSSSSQKITARIDWNIDSKNTLTLKYNYLRSNAEQPQSTSRAGTGFVKGPASQNYTYGLPFSGSQYVINNNFDIYLIELNTRISNHLSNKFQAGYTKERDPRAPGVAGATMPMVDILNGANIYASFGYETYTYNNLINTDVYQLSDVLTLYKGSHELTFGTQNYSRKYTDAFVPSFAGSYQFPSLTAFYNAANGVSNSDSYYQQWSNIPGGTFPFYYAGSTELGFFFQDNWRAASNFTLTYGLRYDMTIYKSLFLDNPYFDALTFKNGSTYNIGQAPGNAVLLSPRVGFNWDPFSNRTLQVRGGFGIFSGPPPFVWLANQGGNNGVLIAGGNYSNVPFTSNAIASPPPPVNTTPPTKTQSASSYGAAVTDNHFKYPTVLKASLAADKKLGDDWIVTLEGSYSKDINAVYFSNLNLNEENGYALSGADTRLRYLTSRSTSNKYWYGQGATGPTADTPNISSAILMKNSSQGYAYTMTARIQKTFRNFFLSLAYTYSQAKNLAAGGSTASSLWSGRPVGNADPNGANLSYADYYQPHRVIAYGSYKVAYSEHFATSVGAIFTAAPSGVGSYTYGGDLNGDGNSGNDLIYIPRNSGEINLIDVGSYNSSTMTGSTTGTAKDPRTSSQIWSQLNNFINQDHYLSGHRGQYAQANAVVFPFYKDLDLNITQDIFFKTKSDRHTLRLSMDLINAGNFLNKNWGLQKLQNTSTPLTFEGMAADGKTPLFSFPYADATNFVPLVNSYSNNTTIVSRWQMQFGIKYLFN